jgi:hypothetical protein
MTAWAVRASLYPVWGGYENNYNLVGHAFIEMWTSNYGTHNTFSRWNPVNFDYNCNNYPSNSKNLSNNICDYDAITVDFERDSLQDLQNSKYSKYRKLGYSIDKPTWDYIVFGSGYRSNYKFDSTYIDLGGDGTYTQVQYNPSTCYNCWTYESRSRNQNYNANYSISFPFSLTNTDYVCSGQTAKMFNAFRNNNSSSSGAISTGWVNGAYPLSPNALYNLFY